MNDESGPLAPPGRYTVRLIANGRTEEKPLVLRRDPRGNATDADLIDAVPVRKRDRGTAAADRCGTRACERAAQARRLQPETRSELRESVIGTPPAGDPDDSIGKPAHDFTSLRYLDDQYATLFAAEQSGDAAPTSDMRTGFAKLNATLVATLQRLRTLATGL